MSAHTDSTPRSAVATRNCAARAHFAANVASLFCNKLILKILTGPSRKSEPAISRVLSRTIIHLGRPSPAASSNLPGNPLGTGGAGKACAFPYLVLLRAGFTVPRAVTSRAVRSYRTFSPLPDIARRYIFCGTFHGLAPSRRYLAPCPKEPGLSSTVRAPQRLPGRLRRSRTADSTAYSTL